MSGIIQVKNRDRGFARLGPDADPVYRGIRELLVQRGYEHELQGADIWVRYLPRRTGGFPIQYARKQNVPSTLDILRAMRNHEHH